MNDLTPERLRELEVWIAENVMAFIHRDDAPERWLVPNSDRVYFVKQDDEDDCFLNWNPTTSDADAVAVLKVIAMNADFPVQIMGDETGFEISQRQSLKPQDFLTVEAKTFALAVALFAFEKGKHE